MSKAEAGGGDGAAGERSRSGTARYWGGAVMRKGHPKGWKGLYRIDDEGWCMGC
jgi:hypothetical protein